MKGRSSSATRRSLTSRTASTDHSPVRNDPVDDERLEVVVADRAAAAVVFLEPVQRSLGEGHGCAGEPEQRRGRGTDNVCEVEVADVHEVLNDVERS